MGGIWITGWQQQVSPDDIRQAIAACRGTGYQVETGKPHQIDVINHNEIHVVWTNFKGAGEGYSIAIRSHGKWTCEERVIVVS